MNSKNPPTGKLFGEQNESSPSWEARLGAWTTSRAASGSPELRGCLRRKWPDHISPGHLRGKSCEDVSGESGLTTSDEGNSELRVGRMSPAKVAGPPWSKASPRSNLRGRLRQKWPDHHGAGHLRGQSCDDVSSESGLTTSAQGIAERRVARMSHATLV